MAFVFTIAAIAGAVYLSGKCPAGRVPGNYIVPADLQGHVVAPRLIPVVANDSGVPADDVDVPPPDFLFYDGLAEPRADVWAVPAYKPRSTFIDTEFLASNVGFANGNLVVRSDVDNHTGGEYKTFRQFLYGKYQASMRLDQTPGTYLTFFLYTPEPGNHNEIDIELVKAGDVTSAILTTWVNRAKNEHTVNLAFDPSEDYHVYAFDWHKDRVDFYIDDMDRPLWTSTELIPQSPCYLYFNSWVVKNVPADHGDGINTQYVDWVTVQPVNDTA